jgi:transposase
VVRVPEPQWEDLRQLHRERDELKKDCNAVRNRITSKLVAQGLRLVPGQDFLERLETLRLFDGRALPEHLKAGLRREYERLQLAQTQLRAVEGGIRALIESADGLEQVRALMQLPGIGWVGAWTLVAELFGWREIRNRRELAALVGLVPVPYNSGTMVREQGISKAGNRRVRALLIQLAWLWLRYQPHSKHSRWFRERFGGGSQRQRRIGIVALARRLVIDLWRFAESGIVPDGTRLKVA